MTLRLVVANRGEIARRILRAGRARGMEVAVVSCPEDREAPVRREADAVLEVPSFLDGPAIVAAARAWGADLLHPGYGFLSENAGFAQAVEDAGLAFVGPTPDQMRRLGGKESAKALARDCGVPTLEALLSHELAALPVAGWAAVLESRGIRAPYLVKASGGGGGRGMRVVRDLETLPEAIRRASEEALAGFGDGTVFVEPYLANPRHVEVQVFGDGRGGGVFLGERECSLQRRHQKVLEEAPSAAVDPPLREALGRAALALVRATSYRGAGTVEFLLEEGRFTFLEMNTRLQVEHPITEEVYGVDLVQAQLVLAEGHWPETLGNPYTFTVPTPRGVALEARILAEDPRNGFLPTPGPLKVLRWPLGVRVDSGVEEGGRVNDRFDSLLAKLIVWAPDRPQAWARLSQALSDTVVLGCTTNLPFLQSLSRHPEVRVGAVSTTWIEAHLADLNAPLLPASFLELLHGAPFREALSVALQGLGRPRWEAAQRFADLRHPELSVDGRPTPPPLRLEPTPLPHRFQLHGLASEPLSLDACRLEGGDLTLSLLGETLHLTDPGARVASQSTSQDGRVCAPMAGKVVEVRVREGDPVEEGQVLFILESMKMQFEVNAPRVGTVRTVLVQPGQILAGPEAMAEVG